MNTFNIESWCKPKGASKSEPMGLMTFSVSDEALLKLEAAEDQMTQDDRKHEMDIPVDIDSLELKLPPECDAVSDTAFHVYRHPHEDRSHFFLTGHRASDGALVYTNAVLVDLANG
ncbi:hypothetical protein [Marinobacterium aestuariivivens]|uniref:Uncharacterized protein n=1 Tax=Marinobacterium aestuariivivens TaxID=1698799 RepID=A0ABW2A5Q9_9GAMM